MPLILKTLYVNEFISYETYIFIKNNVIIRKMTKIFEKFTFFY